MGSSTCMAPLMLVVLFIDFALFLQILQFFGKEENYFQFM